MLPHVRAQLVCQRRAGLVALTQDAEGVDGLPLDLMRQADDRRFGHGRMGDQRAFDFGRAQAVAGDFDNIIHAADDPVIAVFVASRRIAGQVFARILAPVLAHVALRVFVDGAHHRRPRLLEHQVALFAIGRRVAGLVQNFSLLSKEGPCAAARFERHDRRRCNHEHAGLCLPPGVHDWAPFGADHAVIPAPGFGIDRLTHGAKQAQR